MEQKTCIQCLMTKPIADFQLHNHTSDRRYNKCKACKNAQQRLRRPKLPPQPARRARHPNEAMPPACDLWKRDMYRPGIDNDMRRLTR